MSSSLKPHGLHHSRLSCPSLSPRVCSNCIRWVEDAIQLSHPLLPSSPFFPQSFPASGFFPMIWFFDSGGPKYWSFNFSISPSSEYSALISFRFDWFDLLAVQGTLKSLLQHHSSKALSLWCLAFFMIQLSYPYMSIGETIALIIWTLGSRDVSAF